MNPCNQTSPSASDQSLSARGQVLVEAVAAFCVQQHDDDVVMAGGESRMPSHPHVVRLDALLQFRAGRPTPPAPWGAVCHMPR
jgi:hypothetical protein